MLHCRRIGLDTGKIRSVAPLGIHCAVLGKLLCFFTGLIFSPIK